MCNRYYKPGELIPSLALSGTACLARAAYIHAIEGAALIDRILPLLNSDRSVEVGVPDLVCPGFPMLLLCTVRVRAIARGPSNREHQKYP